MKSDRMCRTGRRFLHDERMKHDRGQALAVRGGGVLAGIGENGWRQEVRQNMKTANGARAMGFDR